MKTYRVELCEHPNQNIDTIFFDCEAEDTDHAMEQATSAYPTCKVVDVWWREEEL